MILTGFLFFAFILGILSFFLRSAITDDQSQRVKEVVIIDIKYDNVIGGLLKTVNEFELFNRHQVLSQELYRSIEYIKLKYKYDQSFGLIVTILTWF